jgi:long-subunit fatty acid transport protein
MIRSIGMTSVLLSSMMLCAVLSVNAQIAPGSIGYYEDALRFSRIQSSGTARMLGIGGAQTALGGDISQALVNPAGLGLFRRSEFSITGGMTFYNSEASFNGFSSERPINNFSLPQVGLVISNVKDDIELGKWRGGSFAINFSRVQDFRNESNYRGFNDDNSIIDFFMERADGIPTGAIGNSGLVGRAFDTYLINPIPGSDDIYDSFVLGFPEQQETLISRGRADRIQLSYGGNYDNRLYFGGGIGITTLEYSGSKDFSEFFQGEPLLDLLAYEDIFITGNGFNFNLGVIGKINDNVRIGASLISPTWYNLDEEFSNGIIANYDNYFYAEGDTTLRELRSVSDIFLTNYNMRTPWRVNAGASFIIGKNGFISADVEYVDYTQANLRSLEIDLSADNLTISNLYTNAVNLKVGGEYRYNTLRFRGGYGYYQDPTNFNDDVNRSISSISGGLGLRMQKYFLDLAVVHNFTNNSYSPYTLFDGTQPNVAIVDRSTRAFLTFGLNF